MASINSIASILKNTLSTRVVQKTTSSLVDDCASVFVSKLSPEASFHKFQPQTQREILDFLPKIDEQQTVFLRNLSEINTDEQSILSVIKDEESFNIYLKLKRRINKLFENVRMGGFKEEERLRENISLLGMKDEESYRNLCESKGFKAILNGELSPKYIQEITPDTKIDYNHFYELFEGIEQNIHKALDEIPELDKGKVLSLISAMDDDICRSPEVLDDLLLTLKNHQNPQLVNEIIDIYSKEFSKYSFYCDRAIGVIKLANENPKVYEKVKNFYGKESISLFSLPRDIESLIAENNKIDDVFFEILMKNKDKYCSFQFSDLNDFLNVEGADKKLLDDCIEAIHKVNEKEYQGFSISSVGKNNIDYLKQVLQENKFDKDTMKKLTLMQDFEMFQEPKNWHLIDEIYEKDFLPLMKSLEDEDLAFCISSTRLKNPEKYKQMEDLGIIDLVKRKIINSHIAIKGKADEFSQDILDDVQRLKNGESIIKHFSSFEDAAAKSSIGDVVSINGKMYINNKGQLEAWNMTEECFNKLFPLVDRFCCYQSGGNCFFLSGIESLHSNQYARGSYYKLFEQKGDDIVVTIPAYKDFNGTVIFKNGEIEGSYNSVRGAKHFRMMEQAYARTALRSEVKTPIGKDPLTTNDIDFLNERLDVGGQTRDVMRDLLGITNDKSSATVWTFTPKDNVIEKLKSMLEKNIHKKRLMFNIGYYVDDLKTDGHVISVKAYNAEKSTITICDPYNTSSLEEVSLEEFMPKFAKMWITQV